MSLQSKVKEALQILEEAKKRFKRAYIMFSGGKDSLVVLDLATRVYSPEALKIVFIEVTGNTDTCNIDYVYRIYRKHYSEYELIHLKPEYNFFDLLVRNGIPGVRARWCMDKYKIEPLRRLMPPIFILGIRRTDSTRRAQMYTAPIIRSEWRVWRINILPILDWTKQDVFKYIEQQDLELSPCYRKYGHSGNCMFCPFHRKKAITLTLQDPYWRQKIISSLNKIRSLHDERNKARFKQLIIKYWLKNNVLTNSSIEEYL